MSGISLGSIGTTLSSTLSTKKGRAIGASVATVALTGTLVAVGVNAHADDVHRKQVAAASAAVASAQTVALEKAASDKAAADKAAADKAAADKAAADKAAADKAVADKAAADKAAADKAAADKAAADKAAAGKLAADRAAAAAQANRDAQRQQITTAPTTAPTTSAPTSKPTTSAPTTQAPTSAPTTTGGGGSYTGGTSASAVKALAATMVPSGQFGCFDYVVSRESGWNMNAQNPSSGAYGLGQALPASKMASAGSDWATNPATQIKWVLSYMDGRYGSPCGAEAFWQSHNWY